MKRIPERVKIKQKSTLKVTKVLCMFSAPSISPLLLSTTLQKGQDLAS